jgi:hypothetical protein
VVHAHDDSPPVSFFREIGLQKCKLTLFAGNYPAGDQFAPPDVFSGKLLRSRSLTSPSAPGQQTSVIQHEIKLAEGKVRK